jgi:hypothetical protein
MFLAQAEAPHSFGPWAFSLFWSFSSPLIWDGPYSPKSKAFQGNGCEQSLSQASCS